jgi:hypothetical protein
MMKRAASFAAHAILSLYVFWIWLKDPGLERNWTEPVAKLLDGSAAKPYVYRALIPSLARLLMPLVPEGVKRALADWPTHSRLVATCFQDFKWEAAHAVDYFVLGALSFAFLVGFVLAQRALFRALYDGPPHAADALSLLSLFGLQLFFVYCSYVYDFPALFFFTLALWLMARERHYLYLVTFAVALFNKETTILLAVLFAVVFFRTMERRRYLVLLGAQVALFFVSRQILGHFYGGNRGEFSTWHLYDHNMTYAVLRMTPGTLAAALLLTVAVAAHWSQKPLLLRRALLVILPPLVGGAFFYGYFDELRDFYEAYPAVTLLCAPTVARWMGATLVNRDPSASATR